MSTVDEQFKASPATLQALEFPSLLAVVAQLAATDLAARRLKSLRPFDQLSDLHRHRSRFQEVRRLLADGPLIPSFEESLTDSLERLLSGQPPPSGMDLTLLASLLRTSREAIARIVSAEPSCPALDALAQALPDLSPLEVRISRTLDRRGEVRPDASPELVRLRTQVQGIRDGLYRQLRDYVQENRDQLSEETVPLRGGRLLLTLQSGARGRLSGLTHGRSGSGKSFYFEPLEAVEPNNRLQQSTEDEVAEKHRIFKELLFAVRQDAEGIRLHMALLAEFDVLQAMVRFGELGGGVQPEIVEGQQLRLIQARHPLLEPAFAELRRVALGQAGHLKPVVPLDLDFDAQKRVLVVTGPNAGGKTVALKTAGLLALCALSGLPIPAKKGSLVPALRGLVATVGDDQDLLADRSTFSGRLLRLKEVWQIAAPDTLVLLDELGSGTDPAEGAALAVSLLEALLDRGTLAFLTSHLVQVAAAALDLEGATCAAMEFDAESGAPTFHLVPGPPGGSEALNLARRLGLPSEWLDRAESLLGSEQRDLKRILAEAEKLRQEVAEARDRLAAEVADAALLRERLSLQEVELRDERRQVGSRLKAELEGFRRQTLDRLRDEVTKLAEDFATGRRRGLEGKALERLFTDAPVLEEATAGETGPLEVGGEVRHRTLGWVGTLEKVSRGRAQVRVRGKTLRCRSEELDRARNESPDRDRTPGPRVSANPRDAEGTETRELNLIGLRVEPALEVLDGFLDQALLSSLAEVRVVHGHGTGRLRKAVREYLRKHPAVSTFRPGGDREGGDGATLASLGS